MRLSALGASTAACLLFGGAALAGCGSSSTGGSPSASGCSVTAPSGLFAAGQLTFGSDISYPPQEYYDTNHQPIGFDIDIGKAIAAKMCLQPKFTNQTFDGIIPALDAHKFDLIISAMTITTDRSAKVDFVPYFQAGEQLVVKKGGSHQPAQLTDLCGLNVAAQQGTAEVDEMNKTVIPGCGGNPPHLSTFSTDTEALAQLEKGTVDVEFTDSPVAQYDVTQKPDLAVSSPVLEVAPEGIATRKDFAALHTALAAAFKAIQSDGTYTQVLNKWGLASSALSS